MSHIHCYIFTPLPPPYFFGAKKNVTYNFSLPPPPLIVSYHFSAPPTKTKAKGVGILYHILTDQHPSTSYVGVHKGTKVLAQVVWVKFLQLLRPFQPILDRMFHTVVCSCWRPTPKVGYRDGHLQRIVVDAYSSSRPLLDLIRTFPCNEGNESNR